MWIKQPNWNIRVRKEGRKMEIFHTKHRARERSKEEETGNRCDTTQRCSISNLESGLCVGRGGFLPSHWTQYVQSDVLHQLSKPSEPHPHTGTAPPSPPFHFPSSNPTLDSQWLTAGSKNTAHNHGPLMTKRLPNKSEKLLGEGILKGEVIFFLYAIKSHG